jgi:hypothetical protein
VITVRRAVISVILAACAALMVVGFTQVRPTKTPLIFKNSAVVRVAPEPGDLVLRQSMVTITLAQGYTLAYENEQGFEIGVNGSSVGIPQDELQILPGQNQYSFSPGPGRQFAELPVGRVCVTSIIRRAVAVADPGQKFSWCFQTH